MKEIIKLILKYHFTIIFIILEIISFSLIVLHNNYQRTVFSGYSASFFGAISSTVTEMDNYFSLRWANEKLLDENAKLRNTIEQLKAYKRDYPNGTLCNYFAKAEPDYLYKTAEMINAGFNKTKNYITINKGSLEGICSEMAVCSVQGVVGVIEKVSQHYAKILPLINTNLRVSAKLKKNGYYGSLQWDGNDYRYSFLNDIPFHVNVVQGDTIVTSGFSTIFPEGELIGYVESVNKETANFLTIKVKLATDFKKISDVYIITDTKKQEKQELEDINNE
ncbi:MAG: rod shape-determining protein MreC [Odoribacter sp.]